MAALQLLLGGAGTAQVILATQPTAVTEPSEVNVTVRQPLAAVEVKLAGAIKSEFRGEPVPVPL